MANITAEKLEFMEAEMDRFEAEILASKDSDDSDDTDDGSDSEGQPGSAKFIIGANTFNRVQAQIQGKRSNTEEEVISSNLQPPPQPPSGVAAVLGLAPPPPPPPPVNIRPPSFMPPQLRGYRPPPPPPFMRPPRPPPIGMPRGPLPPRPPMGGPLRPPPLRPPMYGGGPPMGGPPMGGPPGGGGRPPIGGPPPHYSTGPPQNYYHSGPPPLQTHQQQQPSNQLPPPPPPQHQEITAAAIVSTKGAIISASKVVYASAAVRNATTTTSSSKKGPRLSVSSSSSKAEDKGEKKKKKLKTDNNDAKAVVEKKEEKDDSSGKSQEVAPGIQLNVPVEEIDAERAVHHPPAIYVPVTTGSTTMVPMDIDAMIASTTAAIMGQAAVDSVTKPKKEKKRKFVRTAAGVTWEDPTLTEWENDDFRIFCGDLGNEVTDETLARAFSKYPSFVKAKTVRDKRTSKSRGYGFVSFRDPNDFVKAMREMNGKYVGNRPIKLRKSTWKDRQIDIVRKKEKEKKRLGLK